MSLCYNLAYSVTIPYTKVYKTRSLDIIIKNEIQPGFQPQIGFVLSKEPPGVARRKISQIVSIYMNMIKKWLVK